MAPENHDSSTVDRDAPTIDPVVEVEAGAANAQDEVDRRIEQKFKDFAPLLADLIEKKQGESERAVQEEIRSLFARLPNRETIAEMIDEAVDKKAGSLIEQYGMAMPRNGASSGGGQVAEDDNGRRASGERSPSRRGELLELTREISGLFERSRPAQAKQQGPLAAIGEAREWIEAVNGLQSTLAQPIIEAQEQAYLKLRREFELDARLGRDPNERLAKSGEASETPGQQGQA